MLFCSEVLDGLEVNEGVCGLGCRDRVRARAKPWIRVWVRVKKGSCELR